MESWLLYGLLASLSFGSYIVLTKVATSEKYFGLSPTYVSLFMLIGIAILVIGNLLFVEGGFPKNKTAITISVAAGVLWALGILSSLKALKLGADVSRLVPIFNTNTLVAVLLGVIFLHELPTGSELLRVIVGAVFIVLGSVLVAL